MLWKVKRSTKKGGCKKMKLSRNAQEKLCNIFINHYLKEIGCFNCLLLREKIKNLNFIFKKNDNSQSELEIEE